jgi:hypothetical protein
LFVIPINFSDNTPYEMAVERKLSDTFNLKPKVFTGTFSERTGTYREVALLGPMNQRETVVKKIHQKCAYLQERFPKKLAAFFDKPLNKMEVSFSGTTNETAGAKIVLIDTIDDCHPYETPFQRAIVRDKTILSKAAKLLESMGYASPLLAPANYFQIRDEF